MATWRGSENTLAELQALDTTFFNENIPIFVKDEQSWYYWDSANTDAISSPDIVGRSTGLLSTSLNTSLLAYWQLEETGEPFLDATANNLDLNEEASAVVTSVTGKLNNGIRLNAVGTNSGLTLTNALLNIFNASGLVTFNTWITIASGTNMDLALIYYAGDYELWYTGGAAPGSSFFRVITGGVDTVDFNFDISNTNIFSSYVMLTSIWNSNTGTTTIMIDLEIVAIIQNTTIPTGSNVAEFFTESTQGNIDIDETALWTRQLSTKELKQLYDRGNAYGINAVDLTGRWKKTGGIATDELVKITANDTTSGLLFTKLIGGSGISLVEINDGGNEQLQINGSAGGTGSIDRQLYTDTTANIADLASDNITISSDRAFIIGAVETDVASTVRLYSSLAARTADAGRALGAPPPVGLEGLVSEVQLTLGNLRFDLSDAAAHVNMENSQLAEIYATVFNESGGPTTVTVNLYATPIGNFVTTFAPSTYIQATSALADLAGENIEITAVNTLGIVAIETDVPGTVRLYHNGTLRTADVGRALGVPAPTTIQGLVAEVQTTLGNLRIDLNGAALFINTEGPQDGLIYARVFNESGGVSVVNVTVHASNL